MQAPTKRQINLMYIAETDVPPSTKICFLRPWLKTISTILTSTSDTGPVLANCNQLVSANAST